MLFALRLPLSEIQPIALLVSERVVACLIVGTVLTACAGLALRLMSRQTARVKFALCLTTLIGIAIIPVLGWWNAQGAATARSSAAPILRLPEAWAAYICVIWAIGASIALARVAFGLYKVHQVRSGCVPVPSSGIDTHLQVALDRFQSERSVQLCTSDLVRVPTAIGFFRPAVALPAWCLRDLSPGELHSVVLHELEHLRRYDDWTNLFQRAVGAIFFFHPAVWWLESRLSLEREMACDDAVLAVVPDPKSYARCLVSLAEKSYLCRGIALAQAAVSRVHQLTARVTQILDARRPSATSIWKPAFSIVVVTVLAGSASLEVAPRLIAFERGAPQGARSLNTASSAVDSATIASANFGDRSGDHGPSTFAVRPTPARWVEQLRPQKPANQGTRDRAHALNARTAHAPVENSSPRLLAAGSQKATVPPERTVFKTSPAQNLAPQLAALNPNRVVTDPASQAAQPAQAPPPQMLVMVVHTEQHDESGAIFWSVRVVRWMVFHPETPDRVTDPQVSAKT